MKGHLFFSIGTSRTLEEVQKDCQGCSVLEIKPETFEIAIELEFDPDDPYEAMNHWLSKTGHDADVFTIVLRDGQTFTEEDYEE